MPSESHVEPPSSYPKKPLWAATLALCFGPLGTAYTSGILSLAYTLVCIVLITVIASLPLSSVVFALGLSIFFAVAAYRYSFNQFDLTRSPWLAHFDRPGWIKSLFLILMESIVLFGFVFFIRTATSTRGISMLPTIAPGERVAVTILPILRGPIARGTVVRYHVPGRPYQAVSRVVALEGDTVEMKRGLLYVNNKAADSPLLISELRAAGCIDEKLPSSNLAVVGSHPDHPDTKLKVHVLRGQMFLVSDNRAIPIEDSRYLDSILLSSISGVVQLNKHDNRHFTSQDCHPPSYGY